jgi:hypothetical protein
MVVCTRFSGPNYILLGTTIMCLFDTDTDRFLWVTNPLLMNER